MGKIERRLRRVLDEHSYATELSKFRDPDDEGRAVASAEHLTLVEMIRLLERADVWARLNWRGPGDFTHFMADVKPVSNRLMHFSADLPSDDEVGQMRNMLGFLKAVTP